MSVSPDIYTKVTSKIMADLEKGNLKWLQPWQAGHAAGQVSRPLRAIGKPYQGINILLLWASASEQGFDCPIWLTYRQAAELGGQVRKGEKGSLVVYADTFKKVEANEQGEDVEKAIPFLKSYTVFNVQQIDGLPAHFYARKEPQNGQPVESIQSAERFFVNTKATVRHGGSVACYVPSQDLVRMPERQTFRDNQSYYATLAHEITHWTRHETRLNRDFGRKRFGDAGYAMEELVAEMGAAFLCADLGITPETREDHAAYIETWLMVLKSDKRAIFIAAAHAQKAADYLQQLQTNEAQPQKTYNTLTNPLTLYQKI
jgi:antirestriction protein ArdC